jgi:hypothetical protein
MKGTLDKNLGPPRFGCSNRLITLSIKIELPIILKHASFLRLESAYRLNHRRWLS